MIFFVAVTLYSIDYFGLIDPTFGRLDLPASAGGTVGNLLW